MMRIPVKTSLCSTLAIATALMIGARPAAAQVMGTVTNNPQGATIDTGAGTVVLNQQQSVIDWTATGAVNGGVNAFLPGGNTLDFSSGSNFAVLNRVDAGTDMLGLYGDVTSHVDGVAGRGTVFFYNPNGIVVGEGARIDVGSLGLTTNPVTVTANGFVDDFGGADPKVTFAQGLASGQIRTDSGSVLQANGSGSYVALVAPAIQHSGTIRTDGGAALVAAEAATITFSNSNIYTIEVDAGTTKNLTVDGGSIERASEAIGESHRAYLITVPKNDAATALFVANGAKLGFDVAGSASYENNAVVLSAGRDTAANPPSSGQADLTINGATVSSDLTAFATDTLTIASGAGAVDIQRSADLTAGDVVIRAVNGDISFGYSPFDEPAESLTISTEAIASNGSDATAGDVAIEAGSGTSLKVAGYATINADGHGGGSADGENSYDGTGGAISLTANGGSILIGGSLNAHANGYGGTQEFGDASGGRGSGGSVTVRATGSGSATIVAGSTLDAKGIGGSNGECSSCNVVGGNGYGGAVTINADGSEALVSFGGVVNAAASAQGGSGDAAGGDAFGGGYEDQSTGAKGVHIDAASGGTVAFEDSVYLVAGATGGYSYSTGLGGDALGGHINIGFNGPAGASSISVADVLGAYSNGQAGQGASGGEGTGGRVQLAAENGDITVDGSYLDMAASGFGGDGWDGNGGLGRGGEVYLYSRGGSITADGSAYLTANGEGGSADTDGSRSGDGEGGFASVFADTNGQTLLNGYASVYADGRGGSTYGTGANAGNGVGGDARLQASGTNSLMRVASYLYVSASGQGGYPGGECSTCGGLGGDGTGGRAWVDAFDSPTAVLELGETVNINADGSGSYGLTGDGGDGLGGEALFQSTGGAQIHAMSDVNVSAAGYGGDTGAGAGFSGGSGTGGTARIQTHTTAGSAIEIGGLASVSASAWGGAGSNGWYSGDGGAGGSALGGQAQLYASAGAITLHAGANVSSEATGGDGYGGSGGGAVGGLANVNAAGGTLTLDGEGLNVSADGRGGAGSSTGDSGGNGKGGSAIVSAGANGAATLNTSVAISAAGQGGSGDESGRGGDGQGGNAVLALDAATASLIVTGSTSLDASGWGGSATDIGSIGGNGTGGWARIYGAGGTATLGEFNPAAEGPELVSITADGQGGEADGGTGGNGKGGQAWLQSNGAAFTVDGDLAMSARSTGGNGATGGNGQAFIGLVPKNTSTTDARVIAGHGTITVSGTTTLDVSATGGAAESGKGGNAVAGYATIFAENSDLGPATVTMNSVTANADATGGTGGHGTSDQSPFGNGGSGGDGGDAVSGFIALSASSLNGHLDLGDLMLTARSTGGDGGDGGNGSTDSESPGMGGAGGKGGRAGNFAQNSAGTEIFLGTESGANFAALANDGTAVFGDVTMDSTSRGGDGGWGGWADTLGNPGDGGASIGGYAGVNVRGGSVTAGDVTMTGDSFGGNAGAYANESSGGAGGDAIGGGVYLAGYSRSGNTAYRGTMTLGDVSGSASAQGGFGALDGDSTAQFASFDIDHGDIHVDSLAFEIHAASGQDPAYSLFPSDWVVGNGSMTVDGAITIDVPEQTIWLENGTVTADSITLTAGTFSHDPFRIAPSPYGVVSANSFSATTGGDLIIDADLDIVGAVQLTAPGSIALGSVTSQDDISLIANGGGLDAHQLASGGDIDLQANGDLAVGDVAAGSLLATANGNASLGALTTTFGDLVVLASGDIDLVSADAGDSLVLTSETGDITVAGAADAWWDVTMAGAGDVTVGSSTTQNDEIDLSAGGALTVTGDLTSGEGIELEAAGLVRTGDIRAQGGVTVQAGAIDIGNLAAGVDLGLCGGLCSMALPEVDVGLWSETTLDAGNLSTTGRIGMAAGGDITVGTIDAVDLVMVLAGGAVSSGPIDAGGEFYLGGFDMFALGYDPESGDFDAAPILASNPTASGGNVTIAGPLTALAVRANVGGSFTSGDLTTTDGDAAINALGAMSIGTLSIAGNLTLDGGPTTLGGGTVSGYATLIADGDLTALDDLTAYQLMINADGDVSVQGLASFSDLGVLADGDIHFTDAEADYSAWLVAEGSIAGTNLDSGYVSLALADGNVTINRITAASEGLGYIGVGGAGVYDLANGDGFDPYTAYTLVLDEPGAATVNIGSMLAGGINVHGANVLIGDIDFADTTDVLADGTASVGGNWESNETRIVSNDLVVTGQGGITGSGIYLVSTNGIGAGIGNDSGAAQGSWILDGAELSRLTADEVQVEAIENGSDIDLMVGNVTLLGGGRYYDFSVLDSSGEGTDGRLRVTGQITGQNFTDADTLELEAQLVEVDAVNGGIDFSPNSDAAVGTLAIDAQRFHVAETTVLDKLAADPDYAGRDADLATAPDAAHSETTINVGLVDMEFSVPGQGGFALPAAVSPYSIYVQNMGSNGVRSGLLIADAEIVGDINPGDIDMIINGKWVTENGVLSGEAVRDAFVADPDNEIAFFTPTSSINGCGLDGGPCGGPVIDPEPPVLPPAVRNPDTIVLLDTSIGDLLDFNDIVIDDPAGVIEGDDESEAEGNAIDPPQSLIDDKALDPDGATDEPVSGGGNPALIGTGSSKQEDK